jgi:S-DNA-T family DNA segregation ATPase FtsK/SpoIIIE
LRRNELAALGLGLFLALGGLFLAIALLTWNVRDPQVLANYEAPPQVYRNRCGAGGALAASFLFRAHGVAAFAVPAALLGVAAFLLVKRTTETALRRAGGAAVVVLAFSLLAGTAPNGWLASALAERSIDGPGGAWGATPVTMLARLVGGAGTYLVILFALGVGLVLVTPSGVEQALEGMGKFAIRALPFLARQLRRAGASVARRARPRTPEEALSSLATDRASPFSRPSAILPIADPDEFLPIDAEQLRTTRIIAAPAPALGETIAPAASRKRAAARPAKSDVPDSSVGGTAKGLSDRDRKAGAGDAQSDLGRMLLGDLAPFAPAGDAAEQAAVKAPAEKLDVKAPPAGRDVDPATRKMAAAKPVGTGPAKRKPSSAKSTAAKSSAPEPAAAKRDSMPGPAPAEAPGPAARASARASARVRAAKAHALAKPQEAPDARPPLRVVPKGSYILPPTELLLPEDAKKDVDKKELAERGYQIVRTLDEFDIEAELAGYEPGPSVTRYEIRLGPGINVSRVHALVNNIAMAVMSHSVRVVGPIPGRKTIGVEVPNHRMQTVRMRPLIESRRAAASEIGIPLVLGRDATGKPLLADLAAMPHLLIAGTTGSGKSVCMGSIITSILMLRRPDEVRLLLIDPKMVEFLQYGDVPHLVGPVVTEVKRAAGCLEWAVREMQARYEMLMNVRARDIRSYNNIIDDERVRRAEEAGQEDVERFIPDMPYIVAMVDEFADLMDQVPREVDECIGRLAQKSRAVGIHLVLATQRPSVNVIVGSIKANFSARIAFQVPTGVDSNCILGRRGAEKLLGSGDMLFLPPGSSSLVRAKGVFTSEEEVDRVLDHIARQPAVEDFLALPDRPTAAEPEDAFTFGRSEDDTRPTDELYEDAVRVVLSAQRAAVSLLRRRLDIGYPRAGRLIDMMEKNGIIGPFNGSRSREIRMTLDEWEKSRELRKSA